MRVAVLFDTSFALSAEIYEGVAEVSRMRGWDLIALHSSQEGFLRQALEADTLDGVIAPFVSDRWIDGLPLKKVPVVNVSGQSRIQRVPSVVPDDRAVGRLAAQHLLRAGLSRLGCIHQPSDWASCCRMEGFTAYASTHGVEVELPQRPESFSPAAAWKEWLGVAAFPCGVFATDDFLARRFIQECVRSGRAVPDEVAVVGVGNSILDTLLAGVGISSVVLPLREIGRRAAAVLVQSVEGGARRGTETVAPERLVVRASSACSDVRDPVVAKALAIIDTHLSEPPTVAQLAARVGASKRTLETRFLKHLGRAPASEMRERRMALARQLLRSTPLILADIALQCGYADQHHFSAQFRRMHGMPPGEWRRTV